MTLKLITDAWNLAVKRADDLLAKLPDEQLAKQVAPHKNTGIYLLGHLTAVHDRMLPLLDLGNPLFPELVEVFIKNPDSSGLEKPATALLRQQWKEVNSKLTDALNTLNEAQWLEKHTAVSAEDFSKEPHRNKLSVFISRTNHLSYHLGQLVLLA